MCNNLHPTSNRNWKRKFGDKKYGFGYKCFSEQRRFRQKQKGILFPIWRDGFFYVNEWIKWRNDEKFGVGFCFFLTYQLVVKK